MHPIDLNDVKCRISEGCFFALGSSAKYKLERVSGEYDGGTDFRLIRQINRSGKLRDGSSVLEFQVKASVNWTEANGHVKYELKSKNYNDIITRNKEGITPLILILMCLPDEEAKCVNISDREIAFRENLYWYHTDSTELLENENSKKTINIPKGNLLNVDTFKYLVKAYATTAVTYNG